MTKKKPIYHLYQIRWSDAFSDGTWEALDSQDPKRYDVTSVGFLIGENKDYYIFAQSLSDRKQSADRIHIPKKWVTRMHRVKGYRVEYDGL